MTSLIQQENFAIGDETSLKSLAQKNEAKLMVISDSHGNPHILYSIINEFGSGCDALCFCGDGITDLVENIEMGFFDKDFGQKIPPLIFFVKGNGDNSTSTIFTEERIPISVPESIEFTVAGKKIFMTHGHRYGVYYGLKDLKSEAASKDANIVFYGHTHVPNVNKSFVQKKFLGILNPGSCAEARGGMPNTFAIATIRSEVEKSESQYYEVKLDGNGEICFEKEPTPRGDIRMF